MARDVYVSNLPFEVTEEDLRNLFSVSGTVKSIRLLNDPRSGQFRGTAFVQMANAAEAKDAIVTLDGALLLKRLIRVTAALPKKPRPVDADSVRDKNRSAGKPDARRRSPTSRPKKS